MQNIYPGFRGTRLWIWKYETEDNRKDNNLDVFKTELRKGSIIIHGMN